MFAEAIEIINEIIENSNLEKDEFKYQRLKDNSSLSIKFYNRKVIEIKIGKNKSFLFFYCGNEDFIENITRDVNIVNVNGKEAKLSISSIDDLRKYSNEILKLYQYAFLNRVRDVFGCCDQYIECSDAKACVRLDKKRANDCLYKETLDSGRIFYGANKNI